MKFFEKKDSASPTQPEQPAPASPSSTSRPAPPVVEQARQPVTTSQRVSQSLIGSTLSIKGELVADENVTIEGMVDGTVETSKDVIVAAEGRVRADIFANNVVIAGRVKGNITAVNKVDISANGQLEGNIHAPRLAIAESALFRGSIDMSPPKPRATAERKVASGELVKK